MIRVASRRIRGSLAAVAAIVSACARGPESPTITAPAASAASTSASAVAIERRRNWSTRPGERRMQELAERFSSFAGFAFESPGSSTLVIGVKHVPNRAAIGLAVRDYLRTAHVIGVGTPILVRSAPYSFLELDAWRDSIRDELFQLREVTKLDLDELNYRLTIGVRPGADRSRVIALLRRATVPDAAYLIVDELPICSAGCSAEEDHVEGPPETGTLSSYRRPALAGMRIVYRKTDTTHKRCSLGFTGYAWNHGSPLGIVTNSHCSVTPGSVSPPAVYWQPDSTEQQRRAPNTTFATETADPPFPASGPLRRSDALFASAGTQALTNGIARPLGDANSGSLTINTSRPQFRIMDTDGPTLNGRQDKVGYRTGWTMGSTIETCGEYNTAFGARLYCQFWANFTANTGDSGGPVFRFFENMNVGGDNVTIVGLLWGWDPVTRRAYYSPWVGVEVDLGPVQMWHP
jgi:hypothetical protein